MEVRKGKNTIIEKIVSEETGAVISESQETKTVKYVADSFESMAFISVAVIGLFDGLDITEMKLMTYCVVKADYNTNLINLTKPMCSMITEIIGVNYQTIKNTISKLKKKKVLIGLGSGTYRVNPKYAWKGTTTERKEIMKLVLEVECPNCL